MKLSYRQRTGHERTRVVKKSNGSSYMLRRKTALERLENNLKDYQNIINTHGKSENLPEKIQFQLEKAERRIPQLKTEISILKSKLKIN